MSERRTENKRKFTEKIFPAPKTIGIKPRDRANVVMPKEKPYFPSLTEDIAVSVRGIVILNSSMPKIPARANLKENTKNMAKSIGLELLGYNDILEINNAIDSGTKGLPYLTLSSSFVAGLAKNLNSKYEFIGGNTVGTELNNQLSGLSEAINDGFNQLKGSLGSLFNRNTPNSQFSNSTGGQVEQYNQQANIQQQTVEHTEQNTEQYQVVNEQCNKQDKQLKEEKKSGVNLNKDTEDKEDEPISLKKD